MNRIQLSCFKPKNLLYSLLVLLLFINTSISNLTFAQTGNCPDFSFPSGIAIEADGSLVVADAFPDAVFRVDPVTGDRAIISCEMMTSVDQNLKNSSNIIFNCFPNPFYEETEINFEVLKSGNVQIKIYDILGQPARYLASEWMATGNQTIIWDGKNDTGQALSPGVYLISLINEGAVGQQLVLLAK